MSKGKKALIITASIIGGLFILSFLAALAPDDGYADDGVPNTGSSQSNANDGGTANTGNTNTGSDTGSTQTPSNSRPTARFMFQCEHLACDFDGSTSSDNDGAIASYEWDFGDGNTGAGAATSHTYANDGTDWMVKLTVTDDNGATHSTFDFPRVVAPPPEPLEFSGSGDKVTAAFTTQQKLIRVAMDHSGSSNFAIWLLDNQGNNEKLMANEIGSYDGDRYFSVPAGEYRMEVTADGIWSVTIEQPRDSGTSPSAKSGTGDTAIPGITFESGLVVLDMTYQGDSNFAVWVYDSDGGVVELAANEIGNYEGQEAIQIPADGVYYFDVTASGGSWTMGFS